MKNRIYSVYKYTDKSTNEVRHFIDIDGVSEKIRVSAQQYDEILKNAKENGYCNYTEIAYPKWRPADFSWNTYLDLHVIS